MKKKYYVTAAAIYPDRSTKTMRRIIESTSMKKAVIEAFHARKDHGFTFIIHQSPVLVFSHEEDRTPARAFLVDLKRGEYEVSNYKLRDEEKVAQKLEKLA